MFTGDTAYPEVGSEPTPPVMQAPKPAIVQAPVEDIDTTGWKRYGDEEPEPEVARESTALGVQWAKLISALGKGWQWFLKNIVWTGPVAGVLFVGTLILLIMGQARKKKKMAEIKAQIAKKKGERKKASTAGATPKGKGKPAKAAGRFKKFNSGGGAPTQPAPSHSDHIYLCYAGHDQQAATSLRNLLHKQGFEVRCRDLSTEAGKGFDTTTVDNIETAQAVILAASANAYASERVYQETDLAREENKTLIPIYLDAADLPGHLEDLAYEDTFVYFYPEDPEGTLGEILAYVESKDVRTPAAAA